MHGISKNSCRRGRIEAKGPSEAGQGLAEAVRRGNRMRHAFWPPNPVPRPESARKTPPIRRPAEGVVNSPGAPIFMPMTVHFPFQNTYAALPANFFARVEP